MKAIISHDIDHITFWEHYKDLVIPKFYLRSIIELSTNKISLKEFFLRFKPIFTNKWQEIQEIMQFDRDNNIPSTFFIGVNNALGLNYSQKQTKKCINKIIKNNFDLGVHGIAYNNEQEILKEFKTFQQFSSKTQFGIRMHYLRHCKDTLKWLEKVGYSFDATLYKTENPFKFENLIEFPLSIMDGYEIEVHKSWQTRNLQQALDSTFLKIKNAQDNELKYISILFHDRYFSNAFITWKNWYIETINFLKSNNIQFISYEGAIKEILNQ